MVSGLPNLPLLNQVSPKKWSMDIGRNSGHPISTKTCGKFKCNFGPLSTEKSTWKIAIVVFQDRKMQWEVIIPMWFISITSIIAIGGTIRCNTVLKPETFQRICSFGPITTKPFKTYRWINLIEQIISNFLFIITIPNVI